MVRFHHLVALLCAARATAFVIGTRPCKSIRGSHIRPCVIRAAVPPPSSADEALLATSQALREGNTEAARALLESTKDLFEWSADRLELRNMLQERVDAAARSIPTGDATKKRAAAERLDELKRWQPKEATGEQSVMAATSVRRSAGDDSLFAATDALRRSQPQEAATFMLEARAAYTPGELTAERLELLEQVDARIVKALCEPE